MFLTDAKPTPFDITFHLAGTRVRIHPTFWLACAFFGWGQLQQPRFSENGFPEFGLWVLAMTVSILLHEFGHVFAGWAFGGRGEILLMGMGGLAIHEGASFTRWQHILVALAGPAIQLALFLVLYFWLGWPDSIKDRTAGGLFREQMLWINLVWPLFNLLPIWPLDGGQVTRNAFQYASAKHGAAAALWLSLVLSAAIAINSLAPRLGLPHYPLPYLQSDLTALFFALFAVAAWMELHPVRPKRVFTDDDW